MGMNTIRFSGMASGLDTESIVNAMLLKDKNKIDVQKQQQTLLGWKKDAWKEMNTKINTFHTKYIDKLKLQGTYLSNKATVSNPNALEVKTSSNIPTGTHKITEITLAESALMSGKLNVETAYTNKELSSNDKLSDVFGITIEANTSITINGEPINLSADETLGTFQDKLKTVQEKTNLNINLDLKNKAIFISTKTTGESAKIKVESNKEGLVNKFGLTDVEVEGKDASVMYNGTKITSATNEISVNGFEMTLKQAVANGTDPIYISANKDVEGTVKFVKEFIDEYNKLLEEMNTKLDTKKSKKYNPLTDEQKKEMTEDDIKLWEKKIKDGLFYRDSNLSSIRDTLRSGLGGVVENGDSKYNMLSQIGITTGLWQERGKLYLDEEKLKKVLETNPDDVINLLAGTEGDASSKGVFAKIGEQFKELYKSTDLKSYASFYNDKVDTEKGREIAVNIIKLEAKYDRLEKMYYAKFTAMEKALSQMNAQGSSLTSMLG